MLLCSPRAKAGASDDKNAPLLAADSGAPAPVAAKPAIN
jgi:hypothetical protein